MLGARALLSGEYTDVLLVSVIRIIGIEPSQLQMSYPIMRCVASSRNPTALSVRTR